MTYEIKTGTVLVRENALLPANLALAGELCLPGWRIVAGLDGYALDREIRKAGWTFFCIAAEMRASVFGLDGQKMLRRAIERILKGPKLERFNALEIAGVSAVGSARFPGIWLVTVSAHARHIQQGAFLFRSKDPAEWEAGKSNIPGENMVVASSKTPTLSFSIPVQGDRQ